MSKKNIPKKYLKMCRKLDKFELPVSDTIVFRKRKAKKGTTKKDADKYLKEFGMSEAIFYKWFEENKHRLKHKLVHKHCHFYRFEGVIKEIWISIALGSYPEIEFIFNYDDDLRVDSQCFFDIETIEYIGQEAYHPQKGYFDLDRVDHVYTYYPTREELYINEVFEKMIEKCEAKLNPNNSLYLFDCENHTSAFIQATKEDDPNNWRMIRDLATSPTLECKSEEEAKKLFKEEKAYRVEISQTFFHPFHFLPSTFWS